MKKSKSANKIVCQEVGCGSMDLLDITTENHSKKEFLCNSCSNQFMIDFKEYLSTKYGKVEEFCAAVYVIEFKITDGFINTSENVIEFMTDAKSISGERYGKIKKFVTDDNLCHLILASN